jgi:hypothetical protein
MARTRAATEHLRDALSPEDKKTPQVGWLGTSLGRAGVGTFVMKLMIRSC